MFKEETQYKLLFCLITSLCVINLSGCNSNKKDPEPEIFPEPITKEITGIWSAPAYGMVADITDNDYTFYQFTSDSCQIFKFHERFNVDYASLIASTEINVDATSMTTSLSGLKFPGIVMNKQFALPDSCVSGLTAQLGDADYVFDAEAELDIFWQTFSEYYAFFDLENVNWDETYQLALNAVQAETTEEQLFGIFVSMIAPLKDFHVNLVNPNIDAEFSASRKPDLESIAFMDFLTVNAIELPYSQDDIIDFPDYYEEALDKALGGVLSQVADHEQVYTDDKESIFWGKLDGNIGYLLFKTMDDGDIGNLELSVNENLEILATTMDTALSDLADVDGLVIDVRFNEGGTDKISHYIISRLIDSNLVALRKQARLGDERTPLQELIIEPQGSTNYLGAVAVLTSTTTGSAAEVFALAMRERTNTYLIGERSAGGLSDQLPKSLPHGLFYTLSNEFYVSATGEVHEGLGVPVDIEQPFFTLEQRETGTDLGLISAIDWLKNL